MNGDFPIEEKRGMWQRLKHVLKDVLELHIEVADAMKADADKWEEERRLESPAGREKHANHCQQHG